MPDYTIKRLNFRLKEFTRNVWVSNQAGEIWHPRITKLLNYLQEMELQSVAEEIRSCAIKFIDSEEISTINTKFSSYGLEVELLKKVILNSDKTSFKYWAVIGTSLNNKAFKQAFENGEQYKMSSLQGSPVCCTNFFHKMAIEKKLLDMTWSMAVNTIAHPLVPHTPTPSQEEWKREGKEKLEPSQKIIDIEPIFQCNTLLKSLGIKTVFHSPCSFNCSETIELANKLITLGNKIGYTQEINLLREILSWPVEWSALHGIAEIKTPILKISTSTDATAEKYTVRFRGTLYPEESARGVVFPYQQNLQRGI